MIEILARYLVKDRKNIAEPSVRMAYGILCGVVGICLNICLFIGKIVAGVMTRSISITADAFNNLSDAGASFVTLIGFKIAGAKPDVGHPFGHGRMEYISGLAVSGAILIMAFELVKTSLEKIIHPQKVVYSELALVILLVSIGVKLYMCHYNRSIGKKVNSAVMRATATDSLGDACASFVVLLAALIGKYTGLQVDGICGVFVGAFIFYAGIRAARETLNPLLGQAPDPVFVTQVEELVMACDGVCGIHDLLVHDYGPGRRMISLHAEVCAEGNIQQIHDMIDDIETQIKKELKCDAVIHMDPIVTTDERILFLKEEVRQIMKDMSLEMHDFRVVFGEDHVKLYFDVVVPYEFSMTDEIVTETIQDRVKAKLGEVYLCKIQVDKANIKTDL